MSIKPRSVPTKTLAQNLSSSGTTLYLNNTLDWDSAQLSSSDFGTQAFAVLRNSTNTQIEIIEIDPSTIDATSTITILKRGLGYGGGQTADTETKYNWSAFDTYVELGSDTPQLLAQLVEEAGDETIDGIKTFSSIPLTTGGDPSSDNQLARKAYVDLVINGGAVSHDRNVIAGNAGETVAAGDFVYLNASDGEWYKTDADTASTVNGVGLGIAQGAGVDGGAISSGVLIYGLDSNQTGLTNNTLYYLSGTAGAISTSPGTNDVVIGISRSTTSIFFDPGYGERLTGDINNALAGSSGTPDTNNKYVTEDSASVSAVEQSQTTQDASIEFGEADTTTNKNKTAQSFTPTKTKIRGVALFKAADTGTFTGTVTVSLQADSGGNPDGSDLASKTFTNIEWLGFTDAAEFDAIFSSEYGSMTTGNTYWIVVSASTADSSNHPNVGYNTAGGYANGTLKWNNATDGWTEVSGDDMYFKTYEGNASQLIKTNTSGKMESQFYDVSEMPIPAFQQQLTLGDSLTGTHLGSCANPDGSVLVVVTTNTNELFRFERDSVTGMYIRTHNVNVSGGPANGNSGMVVVDTSVYHFYDAGTNLGCYRYDLADLTNETSITISTPITASQSPEETNAWSDGTKIYLVTSTAQTTSHTLSISGTTLNEDTTTTVPTNTFVEDNSSVHHDGTTGYAFEYNPNSDSKIYKFTTVTGATIDSTTTKSLYRFSELDTGGFIIPIDDNRLYIGTSSTYYDETGAEDVLINLVPITKP